MPNKTIYVKDTDLPLLEQAQEQLGDSISSMFAEFLRERVAKLTPEESRIIELIKQIAGKRDTVRGVSIDYTACGYCTASFRLNGSRQHAAGLLKAYS